MKLDRRTLLVGGGAGVGLLVALAVWPRRVGSGLEPGRGEQVFGHYLKIDTDGRVTVAVPQVETGQGVWTALPQIVADELGAAWDKVAVEPAPASPVYANALWREVQSFGIDEAQRVTAGATSVRAFERPLREAGAVARAMLCAAAAERWGVAAAECDTADGFVLHEGKQIGFGEVAEAAVEAWVPEEPSVRALGTRRIAGKSLPRLDLPPKMDGSFRFAGDVRLPRLAYAAAALVPEGGRLSGYDRSVRGVIVGDGWIAALGSTSWAAQQALNRAAPRIAEPSAGSSETIETALRAALDGGDTTSLMQRGEIQTGGRWVTATYSSAPALYLGLEPLTATAQFEGGRLEIWAGTQAPERTRETAARAAGIGVADVLLYPMPVGAPDGRALQADGVPVAVALAKRLGRPVQATLFPGQSRRHDRPRAPALVRLRAKLGPDNRLLAWEQRVAGAGPHDGGFPYTVPGVRIEAAEAQLALASGYMRGGDLVASVFARECFLDELARRGGFEPLSFRIAMLSGQARLARVLSTAAAIGGWDGGAAGSSLGLACLSAYGSHIALLASASIAPDQSVQVDRMVAAVDCGRMINPGLVRQQVEGGLLTGLARAVAPAPTIKAGLIEGGPAAAPRLLRTPAITVELIPSTAPAGGVSGLGDAVLAPAVANAIAAATGKRLRSLPFDPMSAA